MKGAGNKGTKGDYKITEIRYLFLGSDDFSIEQVKELVGEKERFDLAFPTYPDFEKKIQARLGIKDTDSHKYFLTVDDVFSASRLTRQAVAFLSKPRKTSRQDGSRQGCEPVAR